ncbi:MAG: RimK family alpha-L-glutamate ligase [Clostridiales bacterium]|nr:RimK family alpha-L-glutamate ligase [Clostridiales bacterium]
MNKKCIILINAYADKRGTRQTKRLTEELAVLGISAEVRTNDRFPLCVRDGKIEIEDFDCDFCVYLDKDKYIAAMLEKNGVKLFNGATAIELCDDKMLTHIALSNSGIPMPETIPGLLCYDPAAPVPAEVINKVEKKLGYPVIVKHSYGSIGKGVFKADNRKELTELCEKVKLEEHLFQKYIASSSGKDMRVIVIGGKAIGAIKRVSDVDFRSNIGLGARAEKTELPDNVKEISERAANLLNLDYCGIDFTVGDNPLLLEVNSNAYFDAFEAVSGINVARLYAEHIAREIEK